MAVIDKKVFIFHIRKADNSGLFLHPFENFEKMISKGQVLFLSKANTGRNLSLKVSQRSETSFTELLSPLSTTG